MKKERRKRRLRTFAGICAGGMAFQFGGCEFGEITTTSTVSVEQLLITSIRGFIINPIDQFITSRIEAAFGNDEDA